MDIISLVERCKSGDKEAFGLIYQIYLPKMKEVVAYYIHNSDVAWDILHDGFLIAFSSIGTLNNNTRVESWLTTIMKNLSLKYLKEDLSSLSVPVSELDIPDNTTDTSDRADILTWENLDKIINKLPEGYEKVFRLAILDGLSHKEISTLLGIAPHSSSSQLSHAKAMLRRLITEYRIEMGVLSLVAIIALVWHEIFKHHEAPSHTRPIISLKTDNGTMAATDTISGTDFKPDNIPHKPARIDKECKKQPSQVNVTEVALRNDNVPATGNDSVACDTLKRIDTIITNNISIAQEKSQQLPLSETSQWSLALAYAGNLGQNDISRYMMPNPSIPDVECPSEEIEVTEKSHHHMPVVICLSINKTISSRWSVETGIRYTYLRSDILSESKQSHMETIQRIHYIGLPVKFNYRIFTYNGFSVYGQGGGALDIPVKGSHTVYEYSPEWGNQTTSTIPVSAPLQWSVEGGMGLQYHLTPSFSIYAEPSLRYYFNPGSEIKTIRQEKPVEFTLPIGLRLTW